MICFTTPPGVVDNGAVNISVNGATARPWITNNSVAVQAEDVEGSTLYCALYTASGYRFVTDNNVVKSAQFTGSGTTRTLTLDRTFGADVSASLTIPGGGDTTVATLVEGLDGDGTSDFTIATPTLTADALLLWDANNPTALARTSPAGLLGAMVEANPSTTSDTLTSLRLGSTSYALGGGGASYTDSDVRDYLIEGLNHDNTDDFTLRTPDLNADRLLLWDANNVNALSSTRVSDVRALTTDTWARPGATTVIPTARLGTGTASSSTTFLRGDGSWDTPAGGGGTTVTANPGKSVRHADLPGHDHHRDGREPCSEGRAGIRGHGDERRADSSG